VVPRDRIELSTSAFSGHRKDKHNQYVKRKTQCKK
jgi:hypothetical protein